MPRQESYDAARAFLDHKPRSFARTRTDGTALYLHSSRIAWYDDNGVIQLTLAGWGTVTTRDRLNALCDLVVGQRLFRQRKGKQYFNDDPISSTAIIPLRSAGDMSRSKYVKGDTLCPNPI